MRKQAKRKGLFFPAKNKEMADIIRMDSVKGARESISKLRKLIDKGEITIDEAIKYVTCVANRASVQQKRKSLSKKEKNEFKRIASIYNEFKENLKKAKKLIGLR